MTGDDGQHAHQPPGHRPRRAPQPPRIADEDRPDATELDRLRKQAARRWAVRSR